MAGVAAVVARRAAEVTSAATLPGRAGKNVAGDGRFVASEGTRAANRAESFNSADCARSRQNRVLPD